jgi:hypothetical protein
MCPQCGELNLYNGICDNFSAHQDPCEVVHLVPITVVIEYVQPDGPTKSQDPLP